MALTNDEAKEVGARFLGIMGKFMDLEDTGISALEQVRADIRNAEQRRQALDDFIAVSRIREAELVRIMEENFPWHAAKPHAGKASP